MALKSPSDQVVGIAWFERADYPRLLALFEDREEQASTYDEWLGLAERAEAGIFMAGGPRVVRVKLKPDEFADWCKQNGLRTDSKARNRFASEGVRRLLDE